MATSRMSSREFNQGTGRAKRAARQGPVIITERGLPTHILMTFDAYQRLVKARGNILDALGLPKGVENIELEIPTLRDPARSADLR